MIYGLKCWSASFADIMAGSKTYEIRQRDRDFDVGDTLILCEWRRHLVDENCNCVEPNYGRYTGRKIAVKVTHITKPGELGLPENLCVMGIRREED